MTTLVMTQRRLRVGTVVCNKSRRIKNVENAPALVNRHTRRPHTQATMFTWLRFYVGAVRHTHVISTNPADVGAHCAQRIPCRAFFVGLTMWFNHRDAELLFSIHVADACSPDV